MSHKDVEQNRTNLSTPAADECSMLLFDTLEEEQNDIRTRRAYLVIPVMFAGP